MATVQQTKKQESGVGEANAAFIEEKPAWERLPGESIQAYARFVTYRNTPAAERSIRKLGISMQLAARWSKRHQWVKRTAAYDDWLVGLSDDLAQHAVLSSRRQLVRLGSASLAKASQAVTKLDETKITVDEIKVLSTVGMTTIEQAMGKPNVRQAEAPSVTVATSVNFGQAQPSWLSVNQTENKQNEIVVKPSEQVIAGHSRALGVRDGTDKVPMLPPSQHPVKRLRERLVQAPVRNEDE